MVGRIGDKAIGLLETRRKAIDAITVLVRGIEKVHAGLAVEGTSWTKADPACVGGRLKDIALCKVGIPGAVHVVLFGDSLPRLAVLLCDGAGEFDELDAGGAQGMGPVLSLCLGDAPGDLIEEIGGWDRAVERRH